MRFARPALAGLTLLTVLTGTTTGHARDAPARPNVLMIVSDDQAWSDFSPRLMPRVYADIVGQGLLFDRAYASSPVCCPSRSEMLTGLWEHNTGVDGNSIALERPTLPMALHDDGYRTMLAGKYLNSWSSCAPRPEFDRWSCVGSPAPSSYTQVDPWINVDGVERHFTGFQTDILARQVVNFVATTPQDQPFFALYAPTTPHSPADDPQYASMPITVPHPPSFDAETRTAQTPEYARRFPLDQGTLGGINRFYPAAARSVRALDDAVGTLLDGLGSRADDTLVIYVSDNGYMFGEHRRVGKFDAYEESVRVPLAIRYPPLLPADRAGTTKELAANVDIAPTIARLAGIPWHADGVSLVPILMGSPDPVRHAVLLERCQGTHLLNEPCNGFTIEKNVLYPPAFVGVVTARYKYVAYADGARQLFDLVADPSELTNLAGHANLAAVQARLAESLARLRGPPAVDTTIATGPSGTIHTRTVAFTFFSQSRFATYRCRLIRGAEPDPWHDCSTGTDVVGGLTDGRYVFKVAGTDEHGAQDPAPAQRSFVVQTTGGPAVSITSGPPPVQRSRTATFGFTSPVPNASFECRLQRWGDQQPWDPCSAATGATFGAVADGTWNFQVRAIDPVSGESSAPPASQVLRVDNQGPTFRIWARPPNDTGATTATFGFTPAEATQGPLTCSVDHAQALDCSAGTATYEGFTEGVHSFTVSGKDLLGTSRSMVVTWRIDRTAPRASLGPHPRAKANSSSATFGLSSSETPAFFACKVDTYPEMPCSSTWTIGPLGDGPHSFSARAVDRAGRRSDPVTWTWTVDTAKPVVTISGGPGGGSITGSPEASFTLAANEPARFRCSLDAEPFALCTSPASYGGLSPGPHTFRVFARDLAGNVSATMTRTWTVTS